MELLILVIIMFVMILLTVLERRSAFCHPAFAVLLIGMVGIHLIVQGPRWQMYGLYLLVAVLSARMIHRYKRKVIDQPMGLLGTFLTCFIMAISLALLIIFPYNEVGKPSGEYPIGTVSFDVVDEERVELYGDRVGEERKFRVQLWYPAQGTEGLKKGKWLNDGVVVAQGLPAFAGMPKFLLSYTSRIDSNSYLGAEVLSQEGPYPIVVLSHGWLGFRNLHTDLAEMLASHGYVVASVDHTYGSLATVFDDGSQALVDPGALPEAHTVDNFEFYSNNLVTTYALDVKKTIDVLQACNSASVDGQMIDVALAKSFEGLLDVERIGVLGHSTGGGGVTKLAMTDQRVKAVFGFDPWVEPIELDLLEGGLKKPSLYMRSEQWADRENNAYLQVIVDHQETVTELVQLNGTNHQDFTMMYMFEPVSQLIGFSGSLESETSVEIQQAYVQKFFDYVLKGIGTGVSDLVDDYKEVERIF